MTMRPFERIRDIPIQRKLMLLIMVTSGIVLLVTSLVFVIREASNLSRGVWEDIEATADIIGKNTATALMFNDPKAAKETMDGLSSKSGILAAYVLDSDGLVFVRYNSKSVAGRSFPFKILSEKDSASDVQQVLKAMSKGAAGFLSLAGFDSLSSPIVIDGQKVGMVVILADMSGFLRSLSWTIVFALLIMAGTFAVAFILSAGLQKLISVPILTLAGTMKVVSETKNFSLRAEKPGKDEIGLLYEGFNEMLCEIEERDQILHQRQAHLQQLAHYDPLTHLPNRTLYFDRLSQAISYADRAKESVAVLFIDLDHFKDVNDTLGHRTGDILLVEVAKRMGTVVRGCDTVARLGGDEFTIFLQNIKSTENACLVAQKLQDVFALPFRLEGKDLFISASIGITLYPFDGESVDELLMNADIAMYHAKEQGKNNYQLFNKEMTQHTSDRVSLQTDMRLALERNEFFLNYQPKIDVSSGKIKSVEALLRWRHPKIGVVAPSTFIPIAEESGFIIPLTDWVLRKACTQAQSWQDADHMSICVAVNLSPYHFKRQNVVETVTKVLNETGLSPSLLEVEITESSIMQNNDYTNEALRELKRIGIAISIDDFGTGYSSLSYLHRFPIDTLKIDRSFIWNMTKSDEDKAIVTAIIAMAESLKLGVIAEGVETVDQLVQLKNEGCHEIQGYLVSRPVDADEVTAFFSSEDHLSRHYPR
jgi:diguanylate cyclase (GGDEF)-like protein